MWRHRTDRLLARFSCAVAGCHQTEWSVRRLSRLTWRLISAAWMIPLPWCRCSLDVPRSRPARRIFFFFSIGSSTHYSISAADREVVAAGSVYVEERCLSCSRRERARISCARAMPRTLCCATTLRHRSCTVTGTLHPAIARWTCTRSRCAQTRIVPPDYSLARAAGGACVRVRRCRCCVVDARLG